MNGVNDEKFNTSKLPSKNEVF